MEILFCSGISHSVCDESELSQRGWVLSDESLQDIFPSASSRQLPLVYHIDNWYLYDNNDSFDDDSDDANQTSITLNYYIQHNWKENDSLNAFVSHAEFDLMENSDVDDSQNAAGEQGFYDVTMLCGGVISEAQFSSYLDIANRDRMLLHPDLKLEYIMATHHRQRRIAEQLLASDGAVNATVAAAADDDNEDGINKHSKLCREPSKVKPDDFWIRDIADALPSDLEEEKCVSQQCSCESASICSCSNSLPTDGGPQQSSASNSVQLSPISLCSPGRKVIDIAQQLTQEDCSVNKLVEPEAKTARSLSVYETEGISFEPGLVRRTVDLGVDVSASPAKIAAMHPISVYETEDISLEPGLVRRTRQEIEQRERYVIFIASEVFCIARSLDFRCWFGSK